MKSPYYYIASVILTIPNIGVYLDEYKAVSVTMREVVKIIKNGNKFIRHVFCFAEEKVAMGTPEISANRLWNPYSLHVL